MPCEPPRHLDILVAFDGSEASRLALAHAAAAAAREHARLTIVRVVPPVPSLVAAAGVAPEAMRAELTREAERALREAAQDLPGDVSATTLLRHGDPAAEVLALVEEHPYDLVVLGSRGLGRAGTALLGSVSTRVAHESPVEVAVVHPGRGRARPA